MQEFFFAIQGILHGVMLLFEDIVASLELFHSFLLRCEGSIELERASVMNIR